jgi:hypothetical protein
MRFRTTGVVVVTALALAGGVAAIALAPAASATSGRGRGIPPAGIARAPHHPPPYRAKHPTRADPLSGWVASYIGTSSWKVIDQRSIYEPDGPPGQANYDESSDVKFNYQPGTNQEASGFAVPYPTPCRQLRSMPCPPQGGIALGNGRERGSYQIDDTFQTPGQGTNSIICSGPGDLKVQPGFAILTDYVRGTDSYRITVDRDDEDQTETFADPDCPSADAVGNPLGDWFPTEEPGPAVTGAYWAGAAVDVPVTVFAHSKQIQIEVSLRAGNAPDQRNCGLPPNPQAGNYNETCKIVAHWSGTVTLHRLNDQGEL